MNIGMVFIVAASTLAGVFLSGAACAARPVECLKVLTPLSVDTVPVSENFAPVDCASGKLAATFRYDHVSRATRLARAVAPGEIVPAYPEFNTDIARPGQTLRLVVGSGAVRIERQVVAMQSARPGQKLFVKSSDGQILSVRYASAMR